MLTVIDGIDFRDDEIMKMHFGLCSQVTLDINHFCLNGGQENCLSF